VDTHDNDGRSPLHWAAYKGFPDAVKLLLYMDGHLGRPDKEGCTPLHWAAIRGKSEAAHILAQAGGAKLIAARDVEGQTAPQLASEKGHKSLGSFLANLQDRAGKESFWNTKGMAVVCLGLILGLVAMFVHLVVMAPGMPQMDVTWAAWAWIVVVSSGGGLVLMYRVSYNDPGFVGEGSERELRGAGGGGRGGGGAHHRTVGGGGGGGGGGGSKDDSGGGGGDYNSNSHLNHPELWAGNWSQLCTTCRLVKPWGAKHCSVTNKCVHRFDHYCPWMGGTLNPKP
jgi:palmitoyltransferase